MVLPFLLLVGLSFRLCKNSEFNNQNNAAEAKIQILRLIKIRPSEVSSFRDLGIMPGGWKQGGGWK